MNLSKKAISGFISVALFSVWANAGVGSSGGGAAAVCRNGNAEILSAQMLDLYEGHVIYGYQYPEQELDADTELRNALSRFDYSPFLKALVIENINRVQESFAFLPEGVGINTPPDLGADSAVVVPEGCRIEAAGYYQTDGRLLVSRAVYRKLSQRNRAAFILHEALYRIARERSGHKDSALSRRLVAALFSSKVDQAELDEIRRDVFSAPWSAEELNQTGIVLPFNQIEDLKIEVTINQSLIPAGTSRWIVGQRERVNGQGLWDIATFKTPTETDTDGHLFSSFKPYTVTYDVLNPTLQLDTTGWTFKVILNGQLIASKPLTWRTLYNSVPEGYPGHYFNGFCFHFARPKPLVAIPVL